MLNIAGDVAFTVLGAVAVSALTALVTARTTNQRLDKQLKAERERADSLLAAESARQTEQLRHDRELNDLAELRALLDETSRRVSQGVKTSAQVAAGWIRRAESEGVKDRLRQHRQLLRNEVVEIVECHQRIMLRLPRESEVSNALTQVRVAMVRLSELSGPGSFDSHSDAEFMAKGLGAQEVAAAHVAFLDASRKLVGAELPA